MQRNTKQETAANKRETAMHAHNVEAGLGAQLSCVAYGQRAPYALKRIIEHAITVVFDIEACDLRSRSRGTAETAFARQAAMYLAHVAWMASGSILALDISLLSH
jgi:chromosomal replication initiation ATPase DnaA